MFMFNLNKCQNQEKNTYLTYSPHQKPQFSYHFPQKSSFLLYFYHHLSEQ